MIDLDNIEAVAKAAQERSPGPWRCVRIGMDEPCAAARFDYIVDSAPRPNWMDDPDERWDGNRVVETDGGCYEPKEATGVFIAACSPDVVLAMVGRIRELDELRNRITDDEIADLKHFLHESRHGNYCMGDQLIPSPAAERAIEKLLALVH